MKKKPTYKNGNFRDLLIYLDDTMKSMSICVEERMQALLSLGYTLSTGMFTNDNHLVLHLSTGKTIKVSQKANSSMKNCKVFTVETA